MPITTTDDEEDCPDIPIHVKNTCSKKEKLDTSLIAQKVWQILDCISSQGLIYLYFLMLWAGVIQNATQIEKFNMQGRHSLSVRSSQRSSDAGISPHSFLLRQREGAWQVHKWHFIILHLNVSLTRLTKKWKLQPRISPHQPKNYQNITFSIPISQK